MIRREVARLRTADPGPDERKAVERALAQVAQQQHKAARAILVLDDDAAEPLVEQLALLGRRKAELAGEIARVAAREAAWRRAEETLDRIETWRARVARNLRDATYPLKRDVLTALDVRVTLYPAGHEPRYVIEAAVPLPEEADAAIVSSTTA